MRMLLLATAATLSLGAASVVGVGVASAYGGDGHDDLISKIATKFNLNKDEVQKIFDEEHADKKAEQEQAFKDRLNEAIKNGKITQAQAHKISEKHTEMEKYMETLHNKTAAERRQAMQDKREELKQWASDNDIPTEYLGFGNGSGRGSGGNNSDRGMHLKV